MVCIIAGSAGGVKNNLTHFAANVAVLQGLALARAHAPLVAARASDAAPTVEGTLEVLLIPCVERAAHGFLVRLHAPIITRLPRITSVQGEKLSCVTCCCKGT